MPKVQDQANAVNGDVTRMIEKNYIPAKFEPKWVSTRNERNLKVAMGVALEAAGDGVLIEVVGKSGRGKSAVAKRIVSHNNENDWIYLLCLEVWRRSELSMLQAICREVGVIQPPKRSSDCFMAAADRLIAEPRPVFLDEMDLLPNRINLVRQLAEVTGGIFILIGEESLSEHMERVERVWSRTLQTLQFEPVSPGDIIFYASESAGLELSAEAASVIHRSPGGQDWRVVRRATIHLVEIANMNQSRNISEEMARQAVDMGLKGTGRKSAKGGR